MTEAQLPSVASVHLPDGWHLARGQYLSEFGNQFYHLVRATPTQNEDDGLLSVDISPSHPRLWRTPLQTHVESRLTGLRTLGETTVLTPGAGTHPVPYQAEERLVTVGNVLSTRFRVFRQKSRVITIAYTAEATRFDGALAEDLVRRVSDTLLIHLPIVPLEAPSLSTSPRAIDQGVQAAVPSTWELASRRSDLNVIPTTSYEFHPPGETPADDRPVLTLSIMRMSILGPGIRIEAVASPTGGESISATAGPHAQVFQVDTDTLAAMRIHHVGDDAVTITYAAPDYLFDAASALQLLDEITHSIRLD